MSPAVEAPPHAPAPPRPSLTAKTLWSGAATFLHFAGGLLCSILVARILGVEGTGRVALLLWIAELGVLLATLGLAQGLTRYLAELTGQGRRAEAPALARWIFLRYAALVAAGAVLALLLGPRVASATFAPLTWGALGALLFGRGLEALYRAYLTGVQRFDKLARLNALSSGARVAGVAVGATAAGVAGALLGYLAGAALPALLSATALRGPRAAPAPELRRRLWRYALYAWVAALLSAIVWSRMELFFLERHWSAREVALFSVGLTLASLVTAGPLMLLNALLPHFAEKAGARDLSAVRVTYAAATRMVAFVLFPLCFGAAAVLPVLLPLLYGAAFEAAVPVAMVLVASAALAYTHVGSSLIYGLDRAHFIAGSGIVGAGASLAAFALVIPAHGAWGAVWVRVGVQAAMIVWGQLYIAYRLGCPVPVRALFKSAAAALACAAAAYAAVAAWPRPAVLALAVPLGAAVYAGAARGLGALGRDDAARLAELATRVPGARPLLRWLGGSA